VKWYIEALKKYAVFSGRARRQGCWMFFLFNVIIAIALGNIDEITKIDSEGSQPAGNQYGPNPKAEMPSYQPCSGHQP
jgi:hypothetical protein